MSEKITSFTQLRTWQKARELATEIYKISQTFPVSEKYGLTSQIRRSAVSVAANIAEGFSRDGQLDKKRFYGMSMGSLTETLSHAYIAHDLGFIKQSELMDIESHITDIHKMLNGMMKSAKGKDA